MIFRYMEVFPGFCNYFLKNETLLLVFAIIKIVNFPGKYGIINLVIIFKNNFDFVTKVIKGLEFGIKDIVKITVKFPYGIRI